MSYADTEALKIDLGSLVQILNERSVILREEGEWGRGMVLMDEE